MLERMREIICGHDLAVLATCAENQPLCSLMAYIADDDCSRIYMLTLKESRKFRNIRSNPGVSLMVDTRTTGPGDRRSIQALTVNGKCFPASREEQDRLKKAIVLRHPQLQGLAGQEDAVTLEIRTETFLLLDGVENAKYLDLRD